MIPRTLVPRNVKPVQDGEEKKPPRRLTTYMDSRTVVPAGVSDAPPLDGKTTIPSHLPLGVLLDRTLVPRGMPAKPLDKAALEQDAASLSVLESRIVVPAHVEPPSPKDIKEFERPVEMTAELREIVEPDIFITGDANLLVEPEEKESPRSKLAVRIASFCLHIGIFILILYFPRLFPTHAPTQEDIDLAKRQLTLLLPPELPRTPPAPPQPRVHINPKTLNEIAPPIAPPTAPQPVIPQPPTQLPEAPKPQQSANQPPTLPPSQLEPIHPLQKNPKLNLQLPDSSPGKQLHDQLQESAPNDGARSGVYRSAPPPGSKGGPGGPGNGEGYQILSDTQGVDFSSYIRRLLDRVRENWYPVIPESALMGDRGVVYTRFKIRPDGSVAPPDPTLERTSGKDPLDTAAMSALHASNPFEPLPSQFHGPYLELRLIFIYNIPEDQWNFQ